MPLTAKDAAAQISAEIKRLGGWKPANVWDAVISFGTNNTDELQALLNEVLTKEGVLTDQDEARIKEMLDAQKAAGEKTKKIRRRNTALIIAAAVAATGITIYLIYKKKK